jgi:DNA repair protein RAD5
MEYLLRRRKAAIKHLLKKLKMKPVLRGEAVDRMRKKAEVIDFYKDNNGSRKQQGKPSTSSSKVSGIKDAAAVKTEAKEENEEEGSELAKDQVEGVLAKASRIHRDLPEMDPPPHFSLELRSYQKQALK